MAKPKANEPKATKPKPNKPKPKKTKPKKPKKMWVWVGPGGMPDLSNIDFSKPNSSEPAPSKPKPNKPKPLSEAKINPTTQNTPNGEVYEFKIQLLGIKPDIWRVIQVPSSWNFHAFHEAIRDAMGWKGHHSYTFEAWNKQKDKKESIVPSYMMIENCIFADKAIIKDYFVKPEDKGHYEYDLGDSWGHLVTLEKIVPKHKSKKYPICLDGKRACPPEDCGGIDGYKHILDVMKDRKHPEYDEYKTWLQDVAECRVFKPEMFNPKTAYKNWKTTWAWGPA